MPMDKKKLLEFYKLSGIDLLIGAKFFYQLFHSGKI